jgi:hypothetical protein
MANLTQYQRQALELVRARIDHRHPGFTGDETIGAALESMRLYLDSWVYPLLECAMNGELWHGQTDSIKREHASMTLRIRQATAETAARESIEKASR